MVQFFLGGILEKIIESDRTWRFKWYPTTKVMGVYQSPTMTKRGEVCSISLTMENDCVFDDVESPATA